MDLKCVLKLVSIPRFRSSRYHDNSMNEQTGHNKYAADCKTMCRNNIRQALTQLSVPTLQWLRRGYLSVPIYSRTHLRRCAFHARDRAESAIRRVCNWYKTTRVYPGDRHNGASKRRPLIFVIIIYRSWKKPMPKAIRPRYFFGINVGHLSLTLDYAYLLSCHKKM